MSVFKAATLERQRGQCRQGPPSTEVTKALFPATSHLQQGPTTTNMKNKAAESAGDTSLHVLQRQTNDRSATYHLWLAGRNINLKVVSALYRLQ